MHDAAGRGSHETVLVCPNRQGYTDDMVQAVRVNLSQYVDLALSHARFSEDDDGTWTVEVPVLPGCVTWGATRGEAVQMARDAIEAWVLTAIRFGDEVPMIDGCSLQYGLPLERNAPSDP